MRVVADLPFSILKQYVLDVRQGGQKQASHFLPTIVNFWKYFTVDMQVLEHDFFLM